MLARKRASSSTVAPTRTIPIAITVIAAIVSRETSVRRSNRPSSRGSMPCVPIEWASRAQPEMDVVIAITRMSAAERPTATRSMSTTFAGSSPSNAVTMPTSGASSHLPPRSDDPLAPGNAVTPTTATSTVSTTTSPIAEKSERGRVRPGSRASSARFATVSRPV